MIRQLPFSHLIRELLYNEKPRSVDPYCIQAMAVYALQWAAEAFIVGLLKDANLCATHQKVYPDALWHSVGKKTSWWKRLEDIT